MGGVCEHERIVVLKGWQIFLNEPVKAIVEHTEKRHEAFKFEETKFYQTDDVDTAQDVVRREKSISCLLFEEFESPPTYL